MFITYLISGLCISISLMSLYLAYKEVLCVYRNPFPLFPNGTKKFGDIQKKPTRSILKDIEKESEIPYEELFQDLEQYDQSRPKLDELKFVRNLSKKYNQDEKTIIKRIRDVRRKSKSK